ncbi:hypothetical protein J5X84_20300 [Streptosporangiaceae bacterium NEAU-GS5]|nr:hypothetical protein [Streptosporangiaceae bacterium NEAU-GS5]
MAIVENMTPAEELLAKSCAKGAWLDLRTGDAELDRAENAAGWDRSREIRADVIRALLLGAVPADEGCAAAIRLRGARVVGRLDLMGAVADRPLILEHCAFEDEIRFVEAATRTVRMVHCQMKSFNGARMRVEGILNLYKSRISDGLRLDRAKVASEVFVNGTVLGPNRDGVALSAVGITVDGTLDAAKLTAGGALCLQGMRIAGAVILSGSRVTAPGSIAIDTETGVVEGAFSADRLRVDGEIQLRLLQIGASLRLSGAHLNNPGARALGAGGLTVRGGVWMRSGFTAAGEIRFIGARLGANLTLTGASLTNEAGNALTLDHATVEGEVQAAQLTVAAGQVSMLGTHIRSGLGLEGAVLESGPADEPLYIEDATIEGPTRLRRLRAQGSLRIRHSRFGGPVLFTHAVLHNPGGLALRFTRNEIAAHVDFSRIEVRGEVRMGHTHIARDLNFEDAVLLNADDVALEATGLHTEELAFFPKQTEGLVVFDHAHVNRLRDDPARWPAGLHLNGLTYGSLEPRLRAKDRLRWLSRDARVYQPQPYEQLAAFYIQAGHATDARDVLYAKERRSRTSNAPLGRMWNALQDVTVGFGYRPWRAATWLILLLIAGSLVYAEAHPAQLKIGEAPEFNPVVYTLDLLLPVVDLGQQGAYNPTGAQQWLAYALIAAGWVLATTIARGVARVLGR